MRYLILVLILMAWGQRSESGEKGKARILPAKVTTYFTGPLDKDGYVDYFAALNERTKKDIKPEENAAVLLFEALGPKADGVDLPTEFFKALGMKQPVPKGKYFADVFAYLKQHGKEKETEGYYDEIQRIEERPWKAKDHPIFAAWLKSNEKPLALVAKASKRTKSYFPLVVDPKRKSAELLAPVRCGQQECRSLAQTLAIRAMLHLGEGRIDEAWQDLMTGHRLARMMPSNNDSMSYWIAVAMESITCAGDIVFLGSAKLDADGLRKCKRDLAKLPPLRTYADQLELFERCLTLQFVTMTERRGPDYLEPLLRFDFGEFDARWLRFLAAVSFAKLDWNASLAHVNQRFHGIVKEYRNHEDPTRRNLLQSSREARKQSRKDAFIKLLLGGLGDKKRGELLADIFVGLAFSVVDKAANTDDRLVQQQRNLQVAFALEIYQRNHGRYPATLAALTPKYLKEIPNDIFNGKPLNYLPNPKGYLLYSVGPNREDEGGQWYDDEPRGDDPRVRMPLPKMRR